MRSSSSSLYQSGDTLHEIGYQRERPDKDFRVWLREQRLWTALMVQAGRGLDRRLDELLHEVYETGDAFYDLQSRRRLKRLERELHECRRSVQHFENDVEEIALILSTETPIGEDPLPAHFDTVELVLGHVKRKKIADGWVTATNLLISLVILLVTVVWWLESFPR